MDSKPVVLPMSEALRRMTLAVRITGTRQAKIRIWLGAKLILLAAWVMHCNVEIHHA